MLGQEQCSINGDLNVMPPVDEHYPIENMFDKILSDKRAFFRHQQKNEPNLIDAEKLSILREIYDKKPSLFLVRYERFLNSCDAQFFAEAAQQDADIDFIYKRLLQNTTNKNLLLKNRRYVQLKRILDDKQSDYFSDKEMRKRNPLMYDRMIGRFQSKQELTEVMHPESSGGSSALSSALLDMIDNQEISEKKRNQIFDEKMSEMSMKNDDEHERQSASSENEEEEESEISDDETQNSQNTKDRRSKRLEEKDVCRKLFIKDMMESFLNGEDAEYFDYMNEDSNTEKEILRLEEQDEQDRYFSDEESA